MTSKPEKSIALTTTGSPSAIVTVRSTSSCLSFSLTSKPVTRASGEPAVGVERLNPFQVRVETGTVEEVFFTPGDFRALAGGERLLEPALVDRLDALEREAVDLDRPSFFAGDGAARTAMEKATIVRRIAGTLEP